MKTCGAAPFSETFHAGKTISHPLTSILTAANTFADRNNRVLFYRVIAPLSPDCANSFNYRISEDAMTPEEMHLYRRIICEQIALQELQERQTNPNDDPPGLSRRIKHQRRLLSQLWSTARDLGSLKPLV